MVILENHHEFTTVLVVGVLSSVTNVSLELKVGDLEMHIKVNAIVPIVELEICCRKLVIMLIKT